MKQPGANSSECLLHRCQSWLDTRPHNQRRAKMPWPVRRTYVGPTLPPPKRRRRATHGHLAIPHARSSSATGSIRRSEEEAVGPCRTKPLATPQGQKLRIPASITAVINSWAPVAMKNCREQAAKHGLPSPRPDQTLTIRDGLFGLGCSDSRDESVGFPSGTRVQF